MLPPRISLKISHRVITALLFAFLGLISALSIQMVLGEKAIGTESVAVQLIASSASTASAADLSARGRALYDRGDFAGAIDFWQKAVDTYRQLGNEPEKINNQINLAQAEQALGLYPRAYKTLLPIYFDKPIYLDKLDKQDCTTLPQEDECSKMFLDTLKQQANSPSKIAGLRNLGNILRGLGELDISEKVLSLSLEKSAQNKALILLDLGNTKRALSNKEQDLYNRSQEKENLKQAGEQAKAALENYQEIFNSSNFTPSPSSITYIQAKLNQLSFLLELDEWFNQIQKQFEAEQKLEDNPALGAIREQLLDEITQQRTQLQMVAQLTNLKSELPQLQSQIEKLPLSQTTLYMRLNFAQSLRRFKDEQVEPFLKATIEQAKTQKNAQAESYALGYLGKQYKDNQRSELAKKETQKALVVAQSLPDPYILYRWQWQLGEIYKSQGNFKEARLTYKGAFDTLESLRRELATSNPDAQVSFLEDIETIYRQYVDLILQVNNPNPTDLEEARKVIASLQLVELENFLRQACPENNLTQIDKILDTDLQARKTAFLYPIVITDDNKENVRIEVILKLPNSSTGLQHYRSEKINRLKFEKIIRDVQIALQEEYTFDEIKEKGHEVYNWLLKGAEQYLTDIDTLVFAIDTTLRNIPLAVLVDDNQKYIVQKYAIALAPRLEIQDFKTLQDQTKILVAGLSKGGLLREQSEEEKRFPALLHVKKELEAIEALEKGNSRVSVTELCDEDKVNNFKCNGEFTIAKFNQEFTTSPFQIVHLATHGEFSSSPEKTFILALDDKNELPASDLDNKKDTLASKASSNTAKMINVNELYKLFQTRNQEQANTIELLILSACETATGDKRATLGISGVGVRAGAQSAIASLWTLDDSASADFTKELYEQLISRNQKITKAKALQQAQLKFIPREDNKSEYPQYQHPRYWAPYILVGNWL